MRAQYVDVADFRRRQEEQRMTLSTNARRAADAMDVVTCTSGCVVLNDPAHARQVKTARCHVLYVCKAVKSTVEYSLKTSHCKVFQMQKRRHQV